MVKLTGLTDWKAATMRGDAPRARSLTQIARKGHLYPVGGRGPGAPEMGPRDAATAVILSLHDGPPTRCVETFETIANLEWSYVKLSPNGPRGPGVVHHCAYQIPQPDIELPEVFENFPLNPFEALTSIFDAKKRPFWADFVSLVETGAGTSMTFCVHDLEKPVDEDLQSERDFFRFEVRFGVASDPSVYLGPEKRTENALSGHQIDRLFCLIHGLNPEEDEQL